jgi:hypothetical protein
VSDGGDGGGEGGEVTAVCRFADASEDVGDERTFWRRASSLKGPGGGDVACGVSASSDCNEDWWCSIDSFSSKLGVSDGSDAFALTVGVLS